MKKQSGLGRGLSALLDDPNLDFTQQSGAVTTVALHRVEPNPDQPRKEFDEEALQALADSLAEHGMIQPLTVREIAGGYYQIIAGERRWRAARKAGLEEVPVLVIEADDRKVMELALVENLQREDLNPMEEAAGYQTLMEEYGLTQAETAQRVGKSRPAVANALRLLSLSQELAEMVRSGRLLGVAVFKLHGHNPLFELDEHHTYLAAVTAGEEVLGQLLRDGGAAARRAMTTYDGLEQHAEQTARVDTGMVVETHILGSHKCIDEVGRNLVVGDIGACLQTDESQHLAIVANHLGSLEAAWILKLLE